MSGDFNERGEIVNNRQEQARSSTDNSNSFGKVIGLVLVIMLCICLVIGGGSSLFSSTSREPNSRRSASTSDSSFEHEANSETPTQQIPTATPKPTTTKSPTTAPPTAESGQPALRAETEKNGPRLVYVNGDVGNTDIYVANVEGQDRHCVACRSCDEAEPSWSPNGRYVIYQADCDTSYDLWVFDSNTGSISQLTSTSNRDEREPDWSPDGSQIVYRANTDGSERNRDGELMLIEHDGRNSHSLEIWGRSPAWSPDQRYIVFMSERSGSWEIYVHSLQDDSTRKLTSCSTNCRWPGWSPDGSYVVYHTTTAPSSVTADTIWRVSLSGSSVSKIVSGYHCGRPSWSNEGLIAFNSDRGIELVSADGRRRQILISDEQNWAPIWSE